MRYPPLRRRHPPSWTWVFAPAKKYETESGPGREPGKGPSRGPRRLPGRGADRAGAWPGTWPEGGPGEWAGWGSSATRLYQEYPRSSPQRSRRRMPLPHIQIVVPGIPAKLLFNRPARARHSPDGSTRRPMAPEIPAKLTTEKPPHIQSVPGEGRWVVGVFFARSVRSSPSES